MYPEISEAAVVLSPAWKDPCRLTHRDESYPLPFGVQGKYVVLMLMLLMEWVGQDGVELPIPSVAQLGLAKSLLTCF